MPTSQATSTLVATAAPTGHVAAVEHRPPRPVPSRIRDARRAVVLEVTREFYEPRVLILDPPMSN